MTQSQYQQIKKTYQAKKMARSVKRSFDILASFILTILLSPMIVIVATCVASTSGFPVLFKQQRMGRNGKLFYIWKFRTMKKNSATNDGITKAEDDRITNIGKVLRKYRLDEFPQLKNVFIGEMSFVGPRPDVPKYYHDNNYEHKTVLLVRPGITGEATLKFKDEDIILSMAEFPERTYTETIFPEKIRLNIDYVTNFSFKKDVQILFQTLQNVFME